MKTNSKKRYTLVAVMVSIAMIFSVMHSVGYASGGNQNGNDQTIVSANTVKLPSNDSRLMEFIINEAGEDSIDSYARGNKLSEDSQVLYKFLRKQIKAVAYGELNNSEFEFNFSKYFNEQKLTVTSKDVNGAELVVNGEITEEAKKALDRKINFDSKAIFDALCFDIPYELYWFDKIQQNPFEIMYEKKFNGEVCESIILKSIKVGFYVAKDYSKSKEKATYDVDSEKIKAANNAVKKAKRIIDDNAELSDYEKIKAYKEKICEYVSYYNTANPEPTYGDPWQIVNVFDGNESTDVVCEGYAKAFKYLCDITKFDSDIIRCCIVTGETIGGTGNGNHMWNIVRMDDGQNYLVDVTNCDAGTIGADSELFLRCDSGSDRMYNPVNNETAGYFFSIKGQNISYSYDSNTIKLYSDEERTISKTAYNISGTGGGNINDQQVANSVIEKINKLPVRDKVTLSDEIAITAARKAYDNLTTKQKGYIASAIYNKLTDAESGLSAAKKLQENKAIAEEVNRLISNLPSADKITVEHIDIINRIVAAYNNLTAEQQQFVNIAKLTSVQAALIAAIKKEETPKNTPKTSSIKKIGAAGISTVGNLKKNTMTLSWKSVKNAINYCVAYRKAGAKNWTYAWTNGKRKYVIKKLKANQMFEYKVAAYGIEKNKLVYGGWSDVIYRYMATTTTKVKAGKKSFTATIKKVKKSSGYEVIYALNKAQTKSKKVKDLKGAGKTKFVAKKLKKGKRYYVKVRPYKMYKGRKYVGILSKAYKVKVR